MSTIFRIFAHAKSNLSRTIGRDVIRGCNGHQHVDRVEFSEHAFDSNTHRTHFIGSCLVYFPEGDCDGCCQGKDLGLFSTIGG